ncbi:uncharacterized protein LOC110701551 [Chenopodium quinoa]|uniref:uncharacterized protein LOC110701551 n=1 Tax=Chenopodium quinoa TaxID=63459 RepID=UPI000B78239D|nr:uncharacterized protein LOC110701551 [Chenopodium quinoa]
MGSCLRVFNLSYPKGDRHLVKLEAKLRRELEEVLIDEEMLWFQKSRMGAICDGDQNTLKNDHGQWITEDAEGKAGLITVKIDFEEAYYRLRWSFIRESLMKLHLPQLIIEVVMKCISSIKLQILWNREPTEASFPSRGIRQGDPLSPYLYVICMERLAHSIEREVKLGVRILVRASRNGPPISNLAFVDDLILFSHASVEQAEIMMHCLSQFC